MAVRAELMTAGATLAILVGAMLVLASRAAVSASSPTSSRAGAGRLQIGIGLVIVVDQIPEAARRLISREGRFLRETSWPSVQHLPQTSVATLALARRVARADLRPGALRAARAGPVAIAVAVRIAASGLLGLHDAGVADGRQSSRAACRPWSGRSSTSSRRCGPGRPASR